MLANIFRSYGLVFVGMLWWNMANGQIIVDHTLKGSIDRPIPIHQRDMIIDSTLGRIEGGNLFHSFKTFNVEAGETATFTDSGRHTINNVINRVTGGDLSRINGLIKSEIGQAAFYFINPAGIVFGQNAQVDVPAAFHVSTAEAINFADGAVFSATLPRNTSLLTASAPESFGFLTRPTAAVLHINEATLDNFKHNQSISFVGGHLNIKDSDIVVEGGEIRLNAVGNKTINVGINPPASGHLPDSQFTGNTYISKSYISTDGNGGGRIDIQSGSLNIVNDSNISTINTGNRNSRDNQGIHVGVRDTFKLIKSSIDSSTTGKGNAGNITVNAGNIYIDGQGDGSSIQSTTRCGDNSKNCTANAGNLSVTAVNNLNIVNAGFIDTATYTRGNSGKVKVTANNILIDGKGNSTSINSDSQDCENSAFRCGSAGAITVMAKNHLHLQNKAHISSVNQGDGNAANITIKARTVTIDGKNDVAGIHSETDCIKSECNSADKSSAGKVIVDVLGNLQLLNNGSIDSTTTGHGNAGGVNVRAKNILIDGKGYSSGIFSDAGCQLESGACMGNAGPINIDVDESLAMRNKAKISSISDHSQGNANNISINAKNINIDSKGEVAGIFSISDSSNKLGKSGNIDVIARNALNLYNRAKVSTSTFGNAQGGSVKVHAKSVVIDGMDNPHATGVFSEATCLDTCNGKGNGGRVYLRVDDALTLKRGGQVSTTTSTSGNAGSVNVVAKSIHINGNNTKRYNTGILSEATCDDGSTTCTSGGNANNVTVKVSRDLTIEDGGKISTSTTNESDHAATVRVVADTLTMNNGAIKTEVYNSKSNSNGGTINVQSRLTQLNNSQLMTSVEGDGSGGPITMNGNTLILQGGFIQANAVSGKGGEVHVNVGILLAGHGQVKFDGSNDKLKSNFNVIQAAASSPYGHSVDVDVTSPELNISRVLLRLKLNFLQKSDLSTNSCKTSQGSSLVHTGYGRLPKQASDAVYIPHTSINDARHSTNSVMPVVVAKSVSDCKH